jgi:hypothetical protein
MSDDLIKHKNIYIPQRAAGVCIWIKEDGLPLSDADGNLLSAYGLVDDKDIENKVAEAARYWTGTSAGVARWIPGARKVSASERDDQAERLSNGLIADPYEDFFDNYFAHKRSM